MLLAVSLRDCCDLCVERAHRRTGLVTDIDEGIKRDKVGGRGKTEEERNSRTASVHADAPPSCSADQKAQGGDERDAERAGRGERARRRRSSNLRVREVEHQHGPLVVQAGAESARAHLEVGRARAEVRIAACTACRSGDGRVGDVARRRDGRCGGGVGEDVGRVGPVGDGDNAVLRAGAEQRRSEGRRQRDGRKRGSRGEREEGSGER